MAVVVMAVCLALSGCSGVGKSAAPVVPTAKPTGAPDVVRVPSVEDAIRSSDTTASYDQDPQALADQLRASIERYYAQRGLKAVVEYQSIALPDSQEPTAGSMVPSGTVVNVLIGFGD